MVVCKYQCERGFYLILFDTHNPKSARPLSSSDQEEPRADSAPGGKYFAENVKFDQNAQRSVTSISRRVARLRGIVSRSRTSNSGRLWEWELVFASHWMQKMGVLSCVARGAPKSVSVKIPKGLSERHIWISRDVANHRTG